MTSGRTHEPDFARLLGDLAMESPPAYRDDIVQRTARTRQRPAWMFPERWFPVDITTQRVSFAPRRWRATAVLLLLVAALVIATLVAVTLGNRPRLPAPYGPAENGLVAYASGGDIYLGDPVTGMSRVLLDGPETDIGAVFSRDGTRLAVIRESAGSPGVNLHVVNADGSGLRVLTPEPLLALNIEDWSGDGRQILITSGRKMSLVDVERGEVRPLEIGIGVEDPVFRPPDGRQIGFVGFKPGAHGIYLVNSDGTGLHRAAAGGAEVPGYFSPPEFSPDGSLIATSLPDPGPAGSQVHVIEFEGSGDRVLSNPPGVLDQWGPIWSPDGGTLVVLRSDADGWLLAEIPVDGGRGFDIAHLSDVFGVLSLSPDGRQVVFGPDDITKPAVIVGTSDSAMHTAPRWYAGDWQRRPVQQ